jgi:hypothetical protein
LASANELFGIYAESVRHSRYNAFDRSAMTEQAWQNFCFFVVVASVSMIVGGLGIFFRRVWGWWTLLIAIVAAYVVTFIATSTEAGRELNSASIFNLIPVALLLWDRPRVSAWVDKWDGTSNVSVLSTNSLQLGPSAEALPTSEVIQSKATQVVSNDASNSAVVSASSPWKRYFALAIGTFIIWKVLIAIMSGCSPEDRIRYRETKVNEGGSSTTPNQGSVSYGSSSQTKNANNENIDADVAARQYAYEAQLPEPNDKMTPKEAVAWKRRNFQLYWAAMRQYYKDHYDCIFR